MSENQPATYYAVSFGHQRGVFKTYKEALDAMKGFPRAVYKKFNDQAKAEEFVKNSQPESTQFEAKETDTDNKFYAVARGKVIGIFKDLESVKKNTHGGIKSMHKKFTTFSEAKSYVDKFAYGKIDESLKSPGRKRAHVETAEGSDGPKAVARKRTSGKVGDTDDSDGEMDQTQVLNESTEDEEAHEDGAEDNKIGGVVQEDGAHAGDKKEEEEKVFENNKKKKNLEEENSKGGGGDEAKANEAEMKEQQQQKGEEKGDTEMKEEAANGGEKAASDGPAAV